MSVSKWESVGFNIQMVSETVEGLTDASCHRFYNAVVIINLLNLATNDVKFTARRFHF